MTDPDTTTDDEAEALKQLDKDVEAMDRPDRAIPLTKDEARDPGPLPGLAP